MPVNTAPRISHGPGFRRNLNWPARPTSFTGAMAGTQASTRNTVIAAQTLSTMNASLHDRNSDISVPAGTPIMLATV